MARLFAVLAQMEANTCRMEKKMDGMNAKMNNKMDGMTQTMRGEMQQIGRSLQTGIMAFASDETQTARKKMATPRAGTSELKGSATAVRPAVAAGEGKRPRV